MVKQYYGLWNKSSAAINLRSSYMTDIMNGETGIPVNVNERKDIPYNYQAITLSSVV